MEYHLAVRGTHQNHAKLISAALICPLGLDSTGLIQFTYQKQYSHLAVFVPTAHRNQFGTKLGSKYHQASCQTTVPKYNCNTQHTHATLLHAMPQTILIYYL